jgi:diaminopimelate epimerase
MNFYKYQGTGNDFIMVDDRAEKFPTDDVQYIERLCDRRFGIGADGLILLRNEDGYDFKMVYFNSDGRPSSMCGNGGRCIAAFARDMGIGGNELSFIAVDGPHLARFSGSEVELQMKNVDSIIPKATAFQLNTGSPHYVIFQPDVMEFNIIKLAKAIRYNAEYEKEGINVNFVESSGFDSIIVRTYERGVEDETFSCGTGVVASAIASFYKDKPAEAQTETISIQTKGGNLKVKFDFTPSMSFQNVWLIGPAERVFEGEV